MKRLRITVDGKTYEVEVEAVGEDAAVQPRAAAPRARSASVVPPPAAAAAAPAASVPAAAPGDVPSPLAGTVVSIDVKVGQEVAAGDKLVTLEAMKMNTIVSAPTAGTVSAIHIEPSQAVEEGRALLTLS